MVWIETEMETRGKSKPRITNKRIHGSQLINQDKQKG